jgi:ligand-binding sensor domain-containing protein
VYRIKDDSNIMPVYVLDGRDGNLYIGGSKNLLWNLNLQNNKLKKIIFKTDYFVSQITSIQPFDNQQLFLGNNRGLYKINNGQSSSYLQGITVKSFAIHNGNIIVATDRAVFELSLFRPNKRDTIWNNRATCAYKLNDQFYIGTLNSLYVVKNNSTIDLGKIFPELKDKIVVIKDSREEKIWIATESHGLICLKKQ